MHKLTQRNITLALLAAYTVLCLLLLLSGLANGAFDGGTAIPTAVAVVVFAVLTAVYWRGWEPARHLTLVTMALLSAFTLPVPAPLISLSTLIVPLLALILGNVPWLVGVAIFQLIGLVVRSYLAAGLEGMGGYRSPVDIVIYGMAVVGMVLSRLMFEAALRRAEEHAAQAEQALARSEAQAAELSRQAADLSRRNDEQSQLLKLISALETPAVTIGDGVLLAPVVGALDSRRAQDLTARLLREVSERRAHQIVLDIAGVAHVDTEVAASLLRLTQALRLLGCAVTLTGISAPVAASLTQLGVSLGDVRVARSPQEVLAVSAA